MDIVETIASYVGKPKQYEDKLVESLMKLIEIHFIWKAAKHERKKKHMSEGLEVAIKIIAWSIGKPFLINILHCNM